MSNKRVWHRLSSLRRQRFVGRSDEISLFQSILSEKILQIQILYIYSAGGVGKTTLLQEFSHICTQENTPVIYIDARNIQPTPDSFLNAIKINANLSPSDNLLDTIAQCNSHYVILIDTYETLQPLEDWLLQIFLPQLPENALIVLAGRIAQNKAWRIDPGWQALSRTIELRNFSELETGNYLTKRQIASLHHDSILNFTHGHPLALSLVADVFAQQDTQEYKFDLQSIAATDVVKTLLSQFVQEVPSALHRAALEVCALVRLTTETLLAEVLGLEDGYELFDWLRGLSFIESAIAGIFPHDITREAIAADLRWRNPERYAQLFSRARVYYIKRIQQTNGEELERALFDCLFKSQHVRHFFVWQDKSNLVTDSLRETDKSVLLQMVAHHEGKDSAKIAAHWLTKQPNSVLVFRENQDKTPLGFMMLLALDSASVEDLQLDPATQAVWNYIQRQTPLQPEEKVSFCRFWMAFDSYQAVSKIQTLVFIKLIRHSITTTNLAFLFSAIAHPNFWEDFCTAAETPLLRQAYFTVGKRQYGVSGRDYRIVSAINLMMQLPEWILAMNPNLSNVNYTTSIESSVAINQSEFADGVRQALRDLIFADALSNNVLLNSRIVINRIGMHSQASERIATLQLILQEAIESLQKSPREAKFYRALYHSYLHPASTQEKAAEILDVSIATFHRHLKAGITRVTEILWHQEISSGEK